MKRCMAMIEITSLSILNILVFITTGVCAIFTFRTLAWKKRVQLRTKEVADNLLLLANRFDKVLDLASDSSNQNDCTLSVEAIKEDLQGNIAKLEKLDEL